MRGLIPESTLAEIRDRANIVEVVGAQVGLKRVGRNQVGLCPFHAEKSPSFTVNEERGIFHCFGCGAGGNVFTFIMKMENLPFPDVVERLARRYGITLPERGDDDPAIRRREALFRLNEKTASFFQRYLWDASEAEAGRTYLQERTCKSAASAARPPIISNSAMHRAAATSSRAASARRKAPIPSSALPAGRWRWPSSSVW
jgi:DNA primase